jgi:hypothetical protein
MVDLDAWGSHLSPALVANLCLKAEETQTALPATLNCAVRITPPAAIVLSAMTDLQHFYGPAAIKTLHDFFRNSVHLCIKSKSQLDQGVVLVIFRFEQTNTHDANGG